MAPIVKISDLSFSYPGRDRLFNDFAMELDRSEKLALIGSNGSGKSSLMLLIVGLLKPARGTILVFGLDLEREVRAVRRKVGIVFQNPDDQLFCPTVFDDVAFGPLNNGEHPDRVHQIVHEALAAVGLPHVESFSPRHLSFGERRRVALATILAMKPELILLDEPDSNLDPRALNELIEILTGLPIPLVVATHNYELALAVCPTSALIYQGRLIKKDSTKAILFDQQLLEDNGLLMPKFIRALA